MHSLMYIFKHSKIFSRTISPYLPISQFRTGLERKFCTRILYGSETIIQ